MRYWTLLVLLGTMGCTYSVGTPPTQTAATPAPPASSSSGPGHGQQTTSPQRTAGGGQAISGATPGAFAGIEKFDKSVVPLTIICSANSYDVRYSSIAQRRLESALKAKSGPAQTLSIDTVDIRMRCHSEGLGGMSSRCYADTTLNVTISDRASAGSRRNLQTAGRSSESVAFACGSGAQAIEQSMENALGRMADRVMAGN